MILIHGSGDGLATDPYLNAIADLCVRDGFVTLTFDKRGQGHSGGTFLDGRLSERADDLVNAYKFLSSMAHVKASRIGVWGISQGGWVIPLAIERGANFAFAVMVSPAGISPLEQTLFNRSAELRSAHFPASEVAQADELRRTVATYFLTRGGYEAAQAAVTQAIKQPWFTRARATQEWQEITKGGFLPPPATLEHLYAMNPSPLEYYQDEGRFDPSDSELALKVPVLLLYGANDEHVPVGRSFEAFHKAFEVNGNHDFTVHVFPYATHSLTKVNSTGLDWTPGYLDLMMKWIRAHRN